MNCREFEEALAGVLGGDPATESAASHLRECAACQTRSRQMFRLHEALLRRLAPLPESLNQSMKPLLDQVAQDLSAADAGIVEAARARIQELPPRRRRSASGIRRATLVAVVLTLAASIVLALLSFSREPRPVAPQVRGNVPDRRPPLPPPSEKREVAPEAPAKPPTPVRTSEPAENPRPGPKPEEAPTPPNPAPSPQPPTEKAPETPIPVPKTTPRETVVKVGRLEQIKGSVFVIVGGSSEKSPARQGQDVLSGQSILTEGPGSAATVVQADALSLNLEPESTLVFSAPTEISLALGRLSIDLAAAPSEIPLSLSTDHARVRFQRGRFFLHARPESTYFETRLGTAQFTNLRSGTILPITAGQFAAAPAFPGGTQEQIDKAIKAGIEYLKKAPSPPFSGAGIANSDTLLLLTFLHAGVPENDPRFQQLLQDMLKAPIDRTYIAAVQAMILEELDRVRYQPRIVACAQVLIDNQCKNGQWSYGTSSPVAEVPFVDPRPDVATPSKVDAAGHRLRPKLTKKVGIQKTRDGPATGDNSNAQYAALGLRSCFDAGVMIPAEVLHSAARWWRESQFADKDDRKTPYGGKGWCYFDGKGKVNGVDCCKYTYAAMTAGAVGSLVIYDYMLGKDWKSDPNVRSGMEWLTTNFSVTRDFKWGKEIPGDPEDQGAHFYYLYALERLGMFTAQEKLGRHEWYPEGAAVIVERQRADGSWMDIELGNSPVWDTCFAILFLRKATRPLTDVPSVDRVPQKR